MREAVTESRLDSKTTDAFAAAIRGELIRPGDAAYGQARRVWNGMIDRRPGLIARCADVADVRAAVAVAGKHDLLVAVRGGGHNVSGNAVCDGGLVIDLSRLRAVHADPATGRVRAQGGATIGDLDRATQAFGHAVPQGAVSETGIAGLTLGGGLGWLRRKHGLSCDSLMAAEVVTATEELLSVGADTHADLLWGLKGGGGNFGIVTSFEFQAHPVGPAVYVVLTVHPWPAAQAALGFFRDWSADCPDEVSAVAIVRHARAIDAIPRRYHHRPVVVHAAVYAGDPAKGEQVLRPLRGFGRPVADLSAAMPYLELQQLFDDEYPAGTGRYYWKSLYLAELPDHVLDLLVELNEASPSVHSTLDVWQLGGALARVDAHATAFGDRSAPFMLAIEANWREPAKDKDNVAWARHVSERMHPFSTGGQYLNFPGFYEDAGHALRSTYGRNYERLAALKRRYDPTNLFRLNQNVPPR